MLEVFSVSEFISQINDIIAGQFIIEGEVSQYKVSQNKWIFFDLKDENAVMNCFATIYSLHTPLEDGMKIRVAGYPKIHDKSGRFSFTVQKVEVVGDGSLKRAYLLLKEKLTAEGLFSPARKRALTFLPARIGVIASRDSAAFGDFKRILNNRWAGVEIILRHVTVQGETAVQEITDAFREFNEMEEPCEVLVLIRGGGSLEDLAAFNSEEVVRAIYGSRTPVVCGVGHERDESLADFAADVRASTPSNAAEMIVPDKRDFVSQLNFTADGIASALEHRLAMLRRGTEQQFYVISGAFEQPLAKGRQLVEKFGGLLTHLEYIASRKKEFVLSSERLFKNVDPRNVLKRGYSITRDKKSNIIRRPGQVVAGDEIVIELSEGTLKGEVLAPGKRIAQQKLI